MLSSIPMYPCSSCHRHLREDDTTCPFCGTVQHASPSPLAGLGAFALVAAAALGSVGCSSQPSSGEEGMTTTTMSSTSSESSETAAWSSGPADTSTAGDGDGDMTTVTSNTSLSFYAGPDEDFWGVSECDPWQQDCPDGEKCVPYASEGAMLDANKCVPVLGGGATGEPCTYGGNVEATDDCDENNHCFLVEPIDNMLVGVCMEFCGGTPDDPLCDRGTGCLIAYEGSLNLCLQTCDPLMQDCPMGQACTYSASNDDPFMCVVELDPVPALGEACGLGWLDACAAGSFCVGQEVLPDCPGSACCTEYCDVSDMAFMCSNPNYVCQAFFEMGLAPMGYENVGVCTAPP